MIPLLPTTLEWAAVYLLEQLCVGGTERASLGIQ